MEEERSYCKYFVTVYNFAIVSLDDHYLLCQLLHFVLWLHNENFWIRFFTSQGTRCYILEGWKVTVEIGMSRQTPISIINHLKWNWFCGWWKTVPLGLLLRTRHLNSLNNRSSSRRSTLIGWLTRILIGRWLAELYSDWLTDNISTLIRSIICYYLCCCRSTFWNR